MSDPRLAALIERSLRLREERRAILQDERDVVSEAKAVGYDAKVYRTVLKRAEMDADARMELDTLVEAYEAAIAGHKLGDAPVSGDPALQAAFGGKPAGSSAAARRAARDAAWLETGLGD